MSTEHPFVKFQGVSSFDSGWRGRKFRPCQVLWQLQKAATNELQLRELQIFKRAAAATSYDYSARQLRRKFDFL